MAFKMKGWQAHSEQPLKKSSPNKFSLVGGLGRALGSVGKMALTGGPAMALGRRLFGRGRNANPTGAAQNAIANASGVVPNSAVSSAIGGAMNAPLTKKKKSKKSKK